MSSASTARCGQRAAAVAICKGRRVTLHVTLVSHLEIEARQQTIQHVILRGLHHLLKSDEIGVERRESAVDNLRSSSIAFAVPYIERENSDVHHGSSQPGTNLFTLFGF